MFKSKVFLMAIVLILAVFLVGCNFTVPGADGGNLNAVVKIIDVPENMWWQDINWWQADKCYKPKPIKPPKPLFPTQIQWQIQSTSVLAVTNYINWSWNMNSNANYNLVFRCNGNNCGDQNQAQLQAQAQQQEQQQAQGQWQYTDVDVQNTNTNFNTNINANTNLNTNIIWNNNDVSSVSNAVSSSNSSCNVDITFPIWHSEYDKYVYVYFNIENTGSSDIAEFTVGFTAYAAPVGAGAPTVPMKSSDIIAYTGLSTGINLAVGEDRDFFVQIDVSNDKVVFVELAYFEIQ